MHFATPLNKEIGGFGERGAAPCVSLATVRFGSGADLNCERSAVLLKGERTMTVYALRSVDNALTERLLLSDHCHIQAAATALAEGAIVAQAFANFYVITTKADAETVRSVNVMKGRPPLQVGSITTTPLRIPFVFDWPQLPSGVSAYQVLELMDHLFALGPFGFRGSGGTPPARSLDPTRRGHQHRPGHRAWLRLSVQRVPAQGPSPRPAQTPCTSPRPTAPGTCLGRTTSRPTGKPRGSGRSSPGSALVVLEHDDEQGARAAFPKYAPISTSILAFHKTGGPDPQNGRLRLVVERHGSLDVNNLAEVLGRLGFGLTLGANAHRRLSQRQYIPSGTGQVTR